MIVAASIVACLVSFLFDSYQDKLEEWFLSDPGRIGEKLNIIIAVMAVLSIPLLIGAAYLWRIARKIIDAQRFPPPGMPVVRDTAIVTGAKALWRGRLMQGTAIFMGVAAVSVPIGLGVMFHMLLSNI